MTGQQPPPNHATAPVSAFIVGDYCVLVLPINWELQRHGAKDISELMERGMISIGGAVDVVVVTVVAADAVQLPPQRCGGGGLFAMMTRTQNTTGIDVRNTITAYAEGQSTSAAPL